MATIARSLREVYGLARGKGSFGYRVKTRDYIASREKLDPWKREELKYNVVVRLRFVLTPLPLDVDKNMLQKIVDQMKWPAVPLRQLGPATWLLGAEQAPPCDTVTFRNQLVLITAEAQRGGPKPKDTAILAAPQGLRRALDRQLRS